MKIKSMPIFFTVQDTKEVDCSNLRNDLKLWLIRAGENYYVF